MINNKSDNIIINDKFPSSPINKHTIITLIIDKIKQNTTLKKIDYSELFLIIDEAITNAMEHGNNWDPLKHVQVTITHDTKCIKITIEDEGTGFDTNNYSKAGADNQSSRGRGIQIIKHFCEPEWNAAGNQINFRIDVQ